MITTTIDGITTNYVRTRKAYLGVYQAEAARLAEQIKLGLQLLDSTTCTAERQQISELLCGWATEFDYAADAVVNSILYS